MEENSGISHIFSFSDAKQTPDDYLKYRGRFDSNENAIVMDYGKTFIK